MPLSCGPSAVANGPAPALWIAGKKARNIPCWLIGMGCRWPSARQGPTPATTPRSSRWCWTSPRSKASRGRPKELPDERYADRGYDSDDTRWLLRWLGIEPFVGKRKTPHGSGLGRTRWVVERTIGWIKGLRRLRIRYDRLGVIQDAWDTLAACVICFRLLHDDDS